jgi:hypothetical protein
MIVTFDWTEAPSPVSISPAFVAEVRDILKSKEKEGIGGWLREGVQDERHRRYGVADRGSVPVTANKWLSAVHMTELLRLLVFVMNIKNIVGTEPVVPAAALQKARVRRGKLPLLGYTRVDIRLSKALAARVGEAADPRQPVRLHLCRGHFKIRKTGVFWWSPHPRGSAAAGVIHNQDRHVR